LAEHWLWPYELHKRDEISDDFDAIGKALISHRVGVVVGEFVCYGVDVYRALKSVVLILTGFVELGSMLMVTILLVLLVSIYPVWIRA
jgi:hypothetical protein